MLNNQMVYMDLSAQIYGNNGPTKLAPSSSESLDDSVWKARVHPRTHWFLVIFHLTNNAVHGGICLIVRHTHIILDLLSRWCVLILCLFSQWIEVCVLTFSGLPDQHKSWLAASDAERAHRRVGTDRRAGPSLGRKKMSRKWGLNWGFYPLVN